MVAVRAIVKSQGEHMYSGAQPVADFIWSVTGASQLTSQSLRFLSRPIAMLPVFPL